ncbi:MAG: TetR/AcrR family transcriptional regulator [Alphaproteobacteria bacterium]|nr:TetR/AcrR family transcriptional regulator [Alphaproteobacteria bacterium]
MARPDARERLLDAAVTLFRRNGYAATSVDALCAAAGVTKGAFFHHFKSKDALGVAAAEHWTATTSALFATAAYHDPGDPLERVRAYLDFRRALAVGALEEITCLAGTLAQETYASHPAIAQACGDSICGHAGVLEDDIAQAMARHGVRAGWTARSLALHVQVVLQGAFVVAKARGEPGLVAESLDHLRSYIDALFGASRESPPSTPEKIP